MKLLDTLAEETLRTLVDATGPLTLNAIRNRLAKRHGGVVPSHAIRQRLNRLHGLGLVDTYADTIGGVRSRIYWPTVTGREEAP